MNELMEIVILDGYTLNPGDLNWDIIERLGETRIYDRTGQRDVLRRIKEAKIVLTNKVSITRHDIHQADALKYIGVTATGYNVVDIEAARERNIIVTNVPAYGTAAVAQHTFALLLELGSHVGLHSDSVRKGDWSNQPDFSYWIKPMIELHGLTMGIVGLGKIGKSVARIASAVGMKVLAVHKHPERDSMPEVKFTDLQTCFREADVISLHCSLNDENRQFVNRHLLGMMKPSSFILNVSRGGLIDEKDVADALNKGRISGAALDVLSEEPPKPDNPLLTADNCLITPHQAWATQAARSRLMKTVAENIKAFQVGRPQNVVS
jgi:glycerate dehydrogenase